MQMVLPRPLGVLDPLLQYPLRLIDKLPVQIDRVPVHPTHRVVFPKYVLRRLPVVLVHQRAVALAFFRERMCGGAIVAGVGLVGLRAFGS